MDLISNDWKELLKTLTSQKKILLRHYIPIKAIEK